MMLSYLTKSVFYMVLFVVIGTIAGLLGLHLHFKD